MKKPLLCWLGIHKPDKYKYLRVKRWHFGGRKMYHRNYAICERCGKRLCTLSVQIQKGASK